MKWVSIYSQTIKVTIIKIYLSLGFFDPDGYFFDQEGFDQYGGYYDNDGYYHPGPGNKHEFPDYKAHDQNDRRGKQKSKKYNDVEEDDELIRAFERGDQEEDFDQDDDPHISKYLNEYKKVEEVIGPVIEEETPIDDEYGEEEYGEESKD